MCQNCYYFIIVTSIDFYYNHLFIFRLQDEASRYIKKIEMERAKIAELDRQIMTYQEQILDQKTRLGGVNAALVNNKLIQKQIKVLDNRLDKSLLKYNDVIANNKVFRQKIDEYRKERIVFDNIYKKLELDLYQKKKQMTAIINDSKNAYQTRDKSQLEMRNLHSQSDKERSEFEAEFKELGDLIKQQQVIYLASCSCRRRCHHHNSIITFTIIMIIR